MYGRYVTPSGNSGITVAPSLGEHSAAVGSSGANHLTSVLLVSSALSLGPERIRTWTAQRLGRTMFPPNAPHPEAEASTQHNTKWRISETKITVDADGREESSKARVAYRRALRYCTILPTLTQVPTGRPHM